MAEPALPALIQALCEPSLHGDPEGGVRLVETHISWVVLAGEWAYKLKKPVDFGFLDFSTLALRQRYCLEELRLNRRFANDLYVGVVAITGEPGRPAFDGEGPVLEYAVKLRRFDESGLADRLLAADGIAPRHIDMLAEDLAAFHGDAARATAEDPHGLPDAILAAAEANFVHLLRAVPAQQTRLQGLSSWGQAEFGRLREVFWARKRLGFIRECHGDLHCGNLVMLGNRLAPFDCIEFSEELRWIDCLSEIAFLAMDLEVRGRADYAWRLLNRYLEITGDYAGLEVWRFYRVYRALVRAKIAGLSLEQASEPAERAKHETRCLRYLDDAEQAVRVKTPVLLVTHGISGSGKSFVARAVAERLPAIRIASDIERKRLAGLSALAASDRSIYSETFSCQTYALLLGHAEYLLRAGFNVILDATYLRAANRQACRELAGRLGARFFILDMQAPESVLRERIATRLARGDDPSEADLAVLARQQAGADALDSQEQPFVLALDVGTGPDLDAVLAALGGVKTAGAQAV